MQSVIERYDFRYNVPIVSGVDPTLPEEAQYTSENELQARPARGPPQADLDAFVELDEIEKGDVCGIGATLQDTYLPEDMPLILLPQANREQTTTLLAMLPEEIKLLGDTLGRLQEAVEARHSMRSKRINRLTRETTDLRKILSSFAEMPSGYTTTQLEMRRTHLEKTLDAAKDRIDVEERVCGRDILALQGQLDETLREYHAIGQLIDATGV